MALYHHSGITRPDLEYTLEIVGGEPVRLWLDKYVGIK